MAIDFSKHLKTKLFGGQNYMPVLQKAWVDTWGADEINNVKKWEVAEKLDTLTVILAAEMYSGDLKNVEVTKDYLEDQVGTPFEKPKSPKWAQMNTAFCEKSCEAFLMEAFGASPNNKPILALVGTKGKVMLCSYAGTCPACSINFAKQTVIFYGVPSTPATKPAAYHPGCFMKELAYSPPGGLPGAPTTVAPAQGPMRYALRSMGRTADEMRWRRRAKANCHNYVQSGEDPTRPEYHEWRCKCPVAPWNLTKQQRQETRMKHGVSK